MAAGETVESGPRILVDPHHPSTMYFVAITFNKLADPTRLFLATHVEYVTGDDPLTQDEVMERSRKAISATWHEAKPALGSEDNWRLALYVIRCITRRPVAV